MSDPHDAASTADDAIARDILALLQDREPTASICPSEVARRVFGERWRAAMPRIRHVAADLARQRRVRVTRGETEVAPSAITDGGGPIRIRRGPDFPAG